MELVLRGGRRLRRGWWGREAGDGCEHLGAGEPSVRDAVLRHGWGWGLTEGGGRGCHHLLLGRLPGLRELDLPRLGLVFSRLREGDLRLRGVLPGL